MYSYKYLESDQRSKKVYFMIDEFNCVGTLMLNFDFIYMGMFNLPESFFTKVLFNPTTSYINYLIYPMVADYENHRNVIINADRYLNNSNLLKNLNSQHKFPNSPEQKRLAEYTLGELFIELGDYIYKVTSNPIIYFKIKKYNDENGI